MAQNYGFIGLGAMGYPMAKNVRAGMLPEATLWIFDVDKSICIKFRDQFSNSGPIVIAGSAKEVAQNAWTTVSIVPAAQHLRQVYLDPKTGIIAAKGSDDDASRIYVECSTVDEMNMGQYFDCPVSGGVSAADKGTLSIMIGSPAEQSALNGLNNVCNWMGDSSKKFYCGEMGSGLAAKICNNYLSCTILLANAEAMATGIKLGLDPKLLYRIINASTGQNFMLDHVCPVPGFIPHAPSSNGYALGFKSQMLSKDVGLGVNVAKSVNIKPSIGEAAMQVYEKPGKDERFIDLDASIVYRFLGGPE
ncbi:6-phosphogluconate dehydrogenase C-terminal domain-like protein [Pyrenochaeta sp. DS3sAY3a]|nr:6-phosphogluconate dehydrogenase C-terminal domain-like protein [Pyrenochaeta sp. DS3sAY3a]